MQLPAKQRRRRLGGRVVRIHVPVPIAMQKQLDVLRHAIRAETGKVVTRSFVFREGALMLMRQLRVQLAKARKGRLHAKVRRF